MNKSICSVAILIALSFSLGGCASRLTSDGYARAQAQQVMEIERGVIESLRDVRIEGTASGHGASVGSSAGAIIGGIGANTIGSGRGSWIASALGAVAGGLAGAAAEEAVTTRAGVELTVKLNSGRLLAVTQEKDEKEIFVRGDKVRVLTGGGVTRVTMDTATAPSNAASSKP